MRQQKSCKKKVLTSLALFLTTATLLTACSSGKDASETTESTVSITASTLPEGTWQAELTFPDWAGYVDDTLAMNNMYSYETYKDQGTLYISPSAEVESFKLFVNNHEIDTAVMTAGETWKVDIHSYTVNGTNTVQVSQIAPAEAAIQVNIPYPVVIEGTPEAVGINTEILDTISHIIQSDIDNGFPSAQMAVIKDGQLVYQNAWGTVNAYNQDGTPNTDSASVTNDTLYDLASNTKMYSVNYALQYLVSQEKINLDTTIVEILGNAFVEDTIEITYEGGENLDLETMKEWKSKLTVRDILRHQAGFPADPQYHNDAFDQTTQEPNPEVKNVLFSGYDSSEETRARTLESIYKTPLMYEPGTATVYSDVDYMLLGYIIESVTGQGLDEFLNDTFWKPMGLENITYNPLENGFSAEDCAATELNGNTRDGAISFTGVRTDTIQGEVHDEKAYYAMNGVSGHAGMFGTATDIAKLASVMLTGGYGDNKFFTKNVMDTFTAPKKENAANWGLGWWREADMGRAWYFGTQSSRDTIGHQGWTGTLTMIDPDEDLVVVYLTNKINSPVTDIETNRNKFNGNWYTSSTLGFVAQILYQGLNDNNAEPTKAISSLLADMTAEKFKLINAVENLDTNHPIVRSGYAMIEVLFDRAQITGSDADWENAKSALSLLDKDRDAEKLESLNKILSDVKK